MRKGWSGWLMVLAMLCGIAHATLHFVPQSDRHFTQQADADCPLATVCGWGAVPAALAAPGWTVLPIAVPVLEPVRLSLITLPWRSRAPPVAA